MVPSDPYDRGSFVDLHQGWIYYVLLALPVLIALGVLAYTVATKHRNHGRHARRWRP